jgi:hypothetical protein
MFSKVRRFFRWVRYVLCQHDLQLHHVVVDHCHIHQCRKCKVYFELTIDSCGDCTHIERYQMPF